MDRANILCVDDDTTVLTALRSLLGKHLGNGHVVEVAESGAEALEIEEELRNSGQAVSVVISDYIMPGMRGDELLIRMHELSPATVKIMLTGQSDLEGVKRAINCAGLYRFIEKPFDNDDLVMTTRSAVRAFQQDRVLERQNAELRSHNDRLEALVAERTSELQRKNEELERVAVTDPLTGLSNRLKLDQTLAQELARSERYGQTFGVLMLDMDHFKSINDTYGHQAGDSVLRALGDILRANTRESDLAGRWGGEEFMLVAPNTSAEGLRELAEKLRAAVAAHDFGAPGKRTASLGLAAFRAGDNIEQVVARADAALYRAKAAGRNRVES